MNNMIEHIVLYKNQNFHNCDCSNRDKTAYSIKHSPKPLILPEKMIAAIEMLLWYSPNNYASVQTFENKYLNNPIFEDAVITYFLRFLQIKAEDICFVTGGKIDINLVNPYLNSVCHVCQKIIVTQQANETKVTCIFRHLRNCIAHGNFNLLSNDDFIGFDKTKIGYSAVFKIKICDVYSFCEQLIKFPEFTISHIFQYILMKAGYTIIPFETGSYNYRNNEIAEELIFAINKNHAFRINCSRYINNETIDNIESINEYTINYDEQFNEDVRYVNLFYCENEQMTIKKFSKDKYIISQIGLEMLFKGNYKLLNSIELNNE